MTPNKEALFGLSFSIAVAESLMAQEPAKHTLRYRQLSKVVKVCMETLDCYPGELDAAYMDHAARVFDTLQQQTIEGLQASGISG
jgi:hypothetical protein